MIRDRESGLILPGDDPEEWANAILRSDLVELGRQARELYESRLNWSSICRHILQRMGANDA